MTIPRLSAAFAILVACRLSAQDVPIARDAQQQQQQQPKTKLEQFQAKTGSVVVMAYSTVGALQGQYGSTVTVETREFTDATTGTKQFGVYIKVKESSRIERDNASYIDLDEIESLISGIDYIAGLTHAVTKLPDYQADYRTRGDFSVSTFTSGKNDTQAVIKSGRFGTTSAFVTLQDLKRFKQLLQTAAATLEALKT